MERRVSSHFRSRFGPLFGGSSIKMPKISKCVQDLRPYRVQDLLGPVGPPCLELQTFGAKQSRGKIRDTEAKMACGLEGSNSSCVVVSLGSNGQWTFEEDIFARTGCRVEVFDCTVDPGR